MLRDSFVPVYELALCLLQGLESRTIMPDTNILMPTAMCVQGKGVQFRQLRSSEYPEYRAFMDYFFATYDVVIVPTVFDEIFPHHRKRKAKNNFYHKAKGRRAGFKKMLPPKPHKSQLKKRRIQLAEPGMLCTEDMIDTSGRSYDLAERFFNVNKLPGLHGADLQLGPLVTYFNLERGPTSLLTTDVALRRSANKTWFQIQKTLAGNETLENCVRMQRGYFAAPNIYRCF